MAVAEFSTDISNVFIRFSSGPQSSMKTRQFRQFGYTTFICLSKRSHIRGPVVFGGRVIISTAYKRFYACRWIQVHQTPLWNGDQCFEICTGQYSNEQIFIILEKELCLLWEKYYLIFEQLFSTYGINYFLGCLMLNLCGNVCTSDTRIR